MLMYSNDNNSLKPEDVDHEQILTLKHIAEWDTNKPL